MSKAAGLMLDGKIYKKGSAIYCPNNFEINVKTKFSDEQWKKRKYQIKAKDIGFE